jgi:hypothetical protein
VRQFIARLIYQKWFYAFLAVVLWLHVWTDVEDVLDMNSIRETTNLVLSIIAAVLVTIIFLDLHFRWPQKNR